MGRHTAQNLVVSSFRYGLTPKLDMRWGLTNRIDQIGTAPVHGIGDQWLGARYRFLEQGPRHPALALMYAAKFPTANPSKGFGSGFIDHQLALVASRDLQKTHVDFNAVGTLAGCARAYDGAAQFGVAFSRPLTRKLTGILESYGGPQPGVSDRFGAGFAGASYMLRPQFALDAAYAHTYTAGSPRKQLLVGFTYARRPGFAPLPRNAAFAHFLGR